jgi:hypothetical protein
MAFQISSSVPNEGSDALNALLQKENLERGMRMQGFGTMMNSQTANRELDIQEARTAEQANLERLRMLQAGYQFDRGMQSDADRMKLEADKIGLERDALNFRINDAAAARKHDLDLQTSSQDFQTQQDTSFRLWQESTLQKVQAHELEIQKLQADAEAAYDAKSYEEAQAITQRIKDLQIKSSSLSAKISEAQALVGQTAGARDRVRNGMADNIKRMMETQTQSENLGAAHVDDMLTQYMTGAKASARDTFLAYEGTSGFNPFSASTTEVSNRLKANDPTLAGIRWLKFEPNADYGFSRVIAAVSGDETSDARLIQREMTREEMTPVIRGNIVDSVMKSMVGWRIPNMNADAARQLVDGLLDGKPQAELVSMAQAANVPISAVGVLFGKLAGATSQSQDPNSSYARTNAQYLQLLSNNGGQKSLESEALRKAIEEQEIMGAFFRRAANAAPGMSTVQLQAALDHFTRGVETGLIDDATTKELQGLGLGKSVTDLVGLMDKVRADEEGYKSAMRDQGKAAEELKAAQAELPLIQMRGSKAGSSSKSQTLQGLLDTANAEAARRLEEARKYDAEMQARRKARR